MGFKGSMASLAHQEQVTNSIKIMIIKCDTQCPQQEALTDRRFLYPHGNLLTFDFQ